MRTLTLIFFASLWSVTLTAQAAPRLALPEVAFERYVLPNGLQLILHVDRKLPLVHVNLWYHVGSKNEQPGRTGFAHLFEHLMLQGSQHAPEDYFSLVARAGAKGGRDANGTTSQDRTNYFATAPSGSLEYLLWVHADLLATLPAALTQAKLDNQREVVRNERRQGIDNAPYGRRHRLLAEQLFPAGHPYSWPIIGSHEDLQAASLQDVKQFFRTYYTPNNLSLVISGAFEPAEARRFVDRYFGSIPAGPALERPRRDRPPLSGEKVIEVLDRVPQERVFMGWVIPELGATGDRELELAASILGEGLSSRLQKALIYERKLCTAVEVEADLRELAGVFVVDAELRAGAALADVERVITAELARLAQHGPSAAELERARTRLVTAQTSLLQDIGAFGGTADQLNHYNVFFGDPGKLAWDMQRLLAVTPRTLQAAVARWLASDRRVVLRFRPEPARKPDQPEPDRSRPPPVAAGSSFQPPAVQRGQLDNGLELYVVERHELPLVSAALVTRAGSVYDPPGKEGLASLVATSMPRGTRTLGALQLSDALGDLGSELSTYTTLERAGHELAVHSANLPRALGLLADLAERPAFLEADLERERSVQLAEIEQAEQDGPLLARRLRAAFSFGLDHPYGRPPRGYRGSVAGLGRADVVAFHAAHVRPAGAALILVGDVSLARATQLAAAAFGDWRGAAPAQPAIPPPAPPARGRILLVDRPDAAQTTIVQLYAAPARKGDDYYAFRLASEVLGAKAAGRLFLNLRQDKGYSYGVATAFQALSSGMSWLAQGDVQTDKTRESVVEFVQEQRGIAGARPVSPTELEHAREGLIRNYAADFGTNHDVAQRIAELWSRRGSMDELAQETEGLGRATLVEVHEAARRYAAPSNSTLLLIGDRGKIETPLRALKLGDVTIVNSEGRPTP